jgi:hypothetical protein
MMTTINLKKTVIVTVEDNAAFINNLPKGLEELVIDLDGDYETCECEPEDLESFSIGETGSYELCLVCGCVIEEE